MRNVISVVRKFMLGASLLGVAVLAFTATPAFCQSTSGGIVGTVKDATGAVVPNATVTVTNVGTGVTATAKSSQTGDYSITNLLPGSYNMTFAAAGFGTYKLNALAVDLNKTSTANASLIVAANSSVEVEATAGMTLDTTSTNLTETLSNAELSQLPTATIGLGVLNTSLLAPNVATSGGVGAGTGPSVGGQRPRNNNYTIEGIDNNDKGVTGPLVYIPNDAVAEFTLITNQFSPEFGHSSGGQFNTTVLSGSNHFHGVAYEYFDNRDLNAIDASTARTFGSDETPFNPRYDFNRYGAEIGGPVLRDKLFFFANYERQTTGQNANFVYCTPTAAGITALSGIPGLRAENLAVFKQYVPVSPGSAGIDAGADNACFDQGAGPQFTPVFSGDDGTGTETDIPLGNYHLSSPIYSNFDALTTSVDYTLSSKDSFRGRYLYNTLGALDTAAGLPTFWQTLPQRFHLLALSEFHSFTPNLINEARIGFNRFYTNYSVGSAKFPGLDSFPNITLYDLGIDIGPDDNAPQATIQNLYQLTDNVSYTKGAHTFKLGFDGRKYIAPQQFTQRVRGDYEWYSTYNNNAAGLTDYLHDDAPTYFGQRSTGNFTYAGDQTALYGYINDTWRVTPKLTLNLGGRYEFTSLPVGERQQALNSAASAPGVITFAKPEPAKTAFAPRVGINYSPDSKTSLRAGFGMAYDVLYDNQGLLSLPPQFSSTHSVGDVNFPDYGQPGFLAGGGLPAGTGTLATFPTVAAQRAATAAYVPNQVLPYAETWSLGVQHVFGTNYTAELRYVGTNGMHLPAQIQLNKQPKVTAANALPTYFSGSSFTPVNSSGGALQYYTQNTSSGVGTLGALNALSALVPAYSAAGFISSITSYEPYAHSSYNALAAELKKRLQHNLQLDFAYTYSKTMDDATADVYSTVLTPRRAQDSQNISQDYSRSALDRTHRLTLEAIYNFQPFRTNSNWFARNLIGNWLVSPIYTYQSPEYGTANSGDDANLNGDAAPDRTIINSAGNRAIGARAVPIYSTNATLTAICLAAATPSTTCAANTVGYVASNSNAYYVQAGLGTRATASRNTVPLRPIDDVDLTLEKSFQIRESMRVEFGAQAFNVLNHPQYISGSINTINSVGDTSSATLGFLTPSSASFQKPDSVFSSNARSMQLSGKFVF